MENYSAQAYESTENRFMKNLLFSLTILLFALPSFGSSDFKKAYPNRVWNFPKDHGEHKNYKTEWWYYTGNLASKDGRRFGYQLTFFRTALGEKPLDLSKRESNWATSQLYLAHFALTDVKSKSHVSFERFVRGIPEMALVQDKPFLVRVKDWTAEGKHPGDVTLKASDKNGVSISLTLTTEKPIVFQGKNGFSQKGRKKENASFYYSFTHLMTKGTITIGDKNFEVSGKSWMDHEFSTSILEKTQRGWDWFSIQLDDKRELMLFQLRDTRGKKYNYYSGTLISKDGTSRELDFQETTFEPGNLWTSLKKNVSYPTSWIISLPEEEITLKVSTPLKTQEMNTSVRYWEGIIDIEGKIKKENISGKGYMELTGYNESMHSRFQ